MSMIESLSGKILGQSITTRLDSVTCHDFRKRFKSYMDAQHDSNKI